MTILVYVPMAFHYIISEQRNSGFLLLTFVICLCGLGVTAENGPENIKNLQEINVTETTITVQWESSNAVTEFKVLYTNGSAVKEKNVTDTKCTIEYLLPGVSYNITVYSVNGTTTSTGINISVTTLPSIVEGLIISNISTHEMTISWMKSRDPNAATYTYTVDVHGPNFVNQTGLKTNSIVVKNLQAGSDYNITVYALTNNGVQSPVSDVAKATTLPSMVEGLIISNISTHEMTISWMKSRDPNAATYTYTVDMHGPNFVNQTGLKTNSTVVKNLQAGSDYNITVYALTNNGVQSPFSDVVKATTMPSIVEGLIISNISTHEMTISWMKSRDPNAATYTYTVDVHGPNFVNQTGLKTNSIVVKNLQAGSDYNITVYALTNNGVQSPVSDVAKATTLPSIVEGLIISNISTHEMTISWMKSRDPNAATYTYAVDVHGPNVVNQTGLKTNSIVVKNLQAGSDYNITAYALTNNRVQSPVSDVAKATTLPSIVKTFTVAAKTNQSMILKWTFPNNTYVSTYTYTVEVIHENFTQFVSKIKANFTKVENLTAGETYNFTIYTVTNNDIWSYKYPIISDTTMPNEPQSLDGYATGIAKIFIVWIPPKDVHASLYEYNVEWQNVNLNDDKGLNTTKDTHFNISSLFPGNLYTIAVTSVFRNIFSVNALKHVQTNPVSTQNFTILFTTNTTATLNWDLPNYSNSNVNGYRITVLLNGKIFHNQTTQYKNIVVDNLNPGFIYEFRVESFARNSITPQMRSLSQMQSSLISYSTPKTTIGETVPDAVMDPTCSEVDGYQIRVVFKCPNGNYSEIQMLVNDKPNFNCSCTKSNVISGLQPAKGYMVKIITLGTKKSAVTDIFKCYTDSTGVIVGSVLGILLFLLLIGFLVFFIFRIRGSPKTPDVPFTSELKRFHTISKQMFKQHYENNHANSDFGFAEEYQELSSVGTGQSKSAAELPENKAKNRFINVLPYDHSRVKLTTINETTNTDYINANFMPGYNSTKEFIATQGPLSNTTADFWRMIWEYHVNTIVMLTNCMENGRVKCERYWPLDYTPCTYGDLTVTVTSETILPEWTTRDFSVKHSKQQGIQYVRHFHFTAWPDHGVPDSTSSIIQFRNLVREHMDQQKSNGPTVVHCSAGVGRTGTLVALDYIIQQMEKENIIGIYHFVKKMRMNRNLMVQTEEQYIFLNKCMLDLIEEPSEENIYENQVPTDLIYENAAVVRNFQRENVQL
ncbi:receptor-type tyrosine-protein phosphatase H-like isoform X2 [Pyxicephalus adspersus]|uniref:receptor-type tyrosine-protein phosphatase H-like isoform X2 n=1 Tax=Pyxicephalus adspersus TaxID=30357 RepID=UPI003B59867F